MGMKGSIGFPVPEPPSVCSDEECPFHGSLSVRGQTIDGEVVSTDMQKTVIVEREYDVQVPKYDRVMKRRSRIPVHHPPCFELQIGDEVKIGETRPLSKTKSHVVIKRHETVGRESIITRNEKENYLSIAVHGRDMYSLVEYDDFYGLYWVSDLGVGELLAEVISLGRNIHSTTSNPEKSDTSAEIVLNGHIVQDYSKETEMSQSDCEDIFEIGKLWSDFSNSESVRQISEIVSEVDPDLPLTYLRINTPHFNCSWEDTGENNQIGLLTHYIVDDIIINFMIKTIKDGPLSRGKVREQLKKELRSQTGEYKEI